MFTNLLMHSPWLSYVLYSAVSNPQDCSKCFTHYFPVRPVQSNTISTSLGSIQPYAAINAQRLLVHISTTCLLPDTHLYSWVDWSNVEWKNLPKVLTPQHRIRTRVLLVESLTPYPWATALIQHHCNTATYLLRMVTSAPSWDNIIVILRPTPVPPPVTRATLPLNVSAGNMGVFTGGK